MIPKDAKKQFVTLSRAWYGAANLQSRKDSRVVDEICFGWYSLDRECHAEGMFRWVMLGQRGAAVKICVFEDGWLLLSDQKIWQKLSGLHETNPSIEVVEKVLLECGYKDNTEENDPHPDKEHARRIEHVIEYDGWYATQPYKDLERLHSMRCVEIREIGSDKLFETITPPKHWKDWSWGFSSDEDGITLYCEDAQ